MKRLGNIWDDVISNKNAVVSIIDGTKFKRRNMDVAGLLYDDETIEEDPNKWHMIDPNKASEYGEHLIYLLQNGLWRHSDPRTRKQYCRNRTKQGGKWRTLYIPCLDDHIVAHMVMNVSLRAFTKGMDPHCCGNVPGRGINHIVKNVSRWMRNDKQCRYFVKLDIKHFFESINPDLLKYTLRQKIKDKYVLAVFDQIIDSAPVACPVGYYTSPWLANLYLERFDRFIRQNLYKVRRGKRINHVRHYLRYVDDILLIGTCKKDLESAVRVIIKHLKLVYGLDIKPSWEIKRIGKHELIDGKWQLKPDTYWCDFGGYKFCKDATVLRDGIFLSSCRLAKKINKKHYYTLRQCQSMVSRVGWASHADANRYMKLYITPYVDLDAIRRYIGNVAKKREQRKRNAEIYGGFRKLNNSSQKFQIC